jgi:glycosyltransferase involved in cell wall biosynthesis
MCSRPAVLHIVTLVAEDESFGGPTQVALEQIRGLRALGWHANLLAVGDTATRRRSQDDAYRFTPGWNLRPGKGFAYLVAPMMLWHAFRRARRVDVVHLHLARDLVMLPAALGVLLSRRPYVVQAHGMIAPKAGAVAAVVDRFVSRVLRGASQVLCLSSQERYDLEQVAGRSLAVELMPNPVESPQDFTPPSFRQNIVLFAARLHERKRPQWFVEAALTLSRRYPDVEFVLIGPDGGEGRWVNHKIETHPGRPLSWKGPLPHRELRQWMGESRVYALPSRDEPFGLTLLEAMAAGTPTVLCASAALADDIMEAHAALVVQDSISAFTRAIQELLDDRNLCRQLASNGHQFVSERFSVEGVSRKLARTYEDQCLPKK